MSVNALNELERVDAEGLVHTSVEDSREYLRALNPDNNEYGQAGLERNLRVLRAALELEKEGQARTTLIGAMRVLIRANEGALERNDDLVVAIPANKPAGEPIPPRPNDGTNQPALEPASAEGAVEADAPQEGSAEEAPMVHLRFAPKSAFAPHPRLEAIPMSSDVALYLTGKKDERAEGLIEDLAAFNDGVYAHGIIEPVKVVPCPPLLTGEDDGIRWWIVDGRTRTASAQEGDEIPFVEVDPTEVDAIIEGTITGRRNWTKGQKAYLAVIRNPHLLEVTSGERTDLRTECGGSTREEIAGRFGVSLRLLEQAIEVVRTMDNFRGGYPKKVEEMEMEVWAGTGLAQVLSGLKGFGASFGQTKPKPVASAAAAGLAKLAKATKGFGEWDRAQVMAFRDEAQKFWDDLDPSVSEFLTWVKVGATSELEKIIEAHKPAEVLTEGGVE